MTTRCWPKLDATSPSFPGLSLTHHRLQLRLFMNFHGMTAPSSPFRATAMQDHAAQDFAMLFYGGLKDPPFSFSLALCKRPLRPST